MVICVVQVLSCCCAAAIALALLLGCALEPSVGPSIIFGTVFAALTAAELKDHINPARSDDTPSSAAGGGMPSSHATVTAFAAAAWAIAPNAYPAAQLFLTLAALGVAALRVASRHNTAPQAAGGLLLGMLLACTWARLGAWLALAGFFMHRGRARLWRQSAVLAESVATRASSHLRLYLCLLYAALFAVAGLTAAGFATGNFRVDVYLSTFTLDGDLLADLPHRLLATQHATSALAPSCSASTATGTGFDGGAIGSAMGDATGDAFSGRIGDALRGFEDPSSPASTLGPPLLLFVRDVVGGTGGILTPQAIGTIAALFASLEPAISTQHPLSAGAGLVSPTRLFTAPTARLSRYVELECDGSGCEMASALPGGARLRLDAEAVTQVMGGGDSAPSDGSGGGVSPDAPVAAWLLGHCHPNGGGRVRCGPISCCPCDAPRTPGCAPLPLCREDGDELVYADLLAHGEQQWADTNVTAPDLHIGHLAGFEQATHQLLQCAGAAGQFFRSLMAGDAGPASAPLHVPSSTPTDSVHLVAAVAQLRFDCAAEVEAAKRCDGTVYAGALESSGFFNYEELVVQARMHAEYMRLAWTVTSRVEAFNAEQSRTGSPLRASAWGGPAFLSTEAESALFHLLLMVLLSAAATAILVGGSLGSLSLAVLALLPPVLAFPLAWVLFAALTGRRLLGLMQFGGLFVVVGMGVDDCFVLAAAARAHTRAKRSSHRHAMSSALKTSALAISITSLTDAVAFASNWATPIGAVREFGLFVGLLVLVNFALVLLTFPAIYILFAPTDTLPRAPPGSLGVSTIDEASALDPMCGTMPPQAGAVPPKAASCPTPPGQDACGLLSPPPFDLARALVHRIDRWSPLVLLLTLLITAAAAVSLRQLRLDTADYRWAAFGLETNLKQVAAAYEHLAASPLGGEVRAVREVASEMLDHPVWPAKEPMRVVWGSLAATGAATGVVSGSAATDSSGGGAYAGEGDCAAGGLPLSAYDAPTLQLEMERVCRQVPALPHLASSSCLGGHFAAWRRALNSSYPVASFDELSNALCEFGGLSFGDAAGGPGCSADCAPGDAACAAFRATAPSSHPPLSWHNQLRWRAASIPPLSGPSSCGAIALILAEFPLADRPFDASGASLRPLYDQVHHALRGGGGGRGTWALSSPAAPAACATLVHEQLPQMRVEEMLLRSTALSALAAFSAAIVAVYAALRDGRVALLVALHVGLILVLSLATMVAFGWAVGPVEAMMFTVSTGLSIDYVLHIAIAFQRAPRALGALRRTHSAMDELGQSVAQAALTTAFAASFMIPVKLRPFSRFGIYIIANQV